MRYEAIIQMHMTDAEQAQRVLDSLKADDDAHCTTTRTPDGLEARLWGDSPSSLLRAVDDFLACASVAEDVINEPDMGADDA